MLMGVFSTLKVYKSVSYFSVAGINYFSPVPSVTVFDALYMF